LGERSDARGDLRHELKFVADEAFAAGLRMWLRLDRSGIRRLFAPRRVQSLYLDTTYQRALADNLAGLSEREKLRFRWYGDSAALVRGALERKRRENTLGWKQTCAVDEPLAVEGAERHRFMAELARRVQAEWRERLLAGLEPAQWVSYRREYYTSADRRVRLTLDTELRFSDQRLRGRLSSAARTPMPRYLVLELKCAPEDIDAAHDIASRLPIPIGRCSKYALAHDAAHGPLSSLRAV
jgi:hypothetical protein